MYKSSGQNKFQNRNRKPSLILLRDDRNILRDLAARQFTKRFVLYYDFARLYRKRSVQRPYQRRLSCPICSKQDDDLAVAKFKRNVTKHLVITVLNRNVPNLK